MPTRNKAAQAAQSRRWREKQIAAGRCGACGQHPLVSRALCAACLEDSRRRTAAYRDRTRDALFAAYGGYVCACCGETERQFLTLDHVNNDGAAHRRALGGQCGMRHVYADLKRRGFPPGYQVLCFNCNLGRARNGGVCPHRRVVT